MIYRIFILLIVSLFWLTNCTKPPEVIPEEVIDYSYDELKTKFFSCTGEGIMSAKGILPWKLNYSFTTQNDSSFLLFRDIFGRRLLFVQAIPDEIMLWDIQNNTQINSENQSAIPLFNIMESYDLAQILWGEIPNKFDETNKISDFERDSNLVNFESSATQIGMVLDKVLFNIEPYDTIVEFIISNRDYGKTDSELLKGIPTDIPLN